MHVEKFEANLIGYDVFISDLHGCKSDFLKILEALSFNPLTDRVFSVGDLIDRGSDSLGTLSLLNNHWFNAVLGNHEQMWLDWNNRQFPDDLYIKNGGRWAFDSSNDEKENIKQLIQTMPIAIQVDSVFGNIGVCHAEVPLTDWNELLNRIEFDDALQQKTLWSRMSVLYGQEVVQNCAATIHGHTITENLIQHGNAHWIDHGMYKSHKAGIIILNNLNKTLNYYLMQSYAESGEIKWQKQKEVALLQPQSAMQKVINQK